MTLGTRAILGLFCNNNNNIKAIWFSATLVYLEWQSCRLIVLRAVFPFTLHVPYLAFAAISSQSDQLCFTRPWTSYRNNYVSDLCRLSETWGWGGRKEHMQFPAPFSPCLSLCQIAFTNHLLSYSIKCLLGNQDIKEDVFLFLCVYCKWERNSNQFRRTFLLWFMLPSPPFLLQSMSHDCS